MTRPTISSLTSFRFFAALAVVIFHYNLGRDVFPTAISSFGYEAVTFFFVLSGFILTYAHVAVTSNGAKMNVSTQEFIILRLARIVPAYFVALVVAAPYFVYEAMVGTIDTQLFVIGALLVPLMAQTWYPPASLLWNMPAWSLSNELFFYGMYSALLQAICRVPMRSRLLMAFGVVLVVDLFRELTRDLDSVAWQLFLAYFPLLNLPQFVLGIVLGLAFFANPKRSLVSYDLVLLSSLVVLALVIVFKPSAPWLGSATILSVVFGSVIFGAAKADGCLKQIFSAQPLVLLGDASYAIYIIHVPLWYWWRRLNNVYLHTNHHQAVDFALFLAAVICVSILIVIFIERPARRWMTARLIRAASPNPTVANPKALAGPWARNP